MTHATKIYKNYAVLRVLGFSKKWMIARRRPNVSATVWVRAISKNFQTQAQAIEFLRDNSEALTTYLEK